MKPFEKLGQDFPLRGLFEEVSSNRQIHFELKFKESTLSFRLLSRFSPEGGQVLSTKDRLIIDQGVRVSRTTSLKSQPWLTYHFASRMSSKTVEIA
jgi:hypothetical protein